LPESVEIEVADTGCGIPQTHLSHIFDRFYRVPTKESRTDPERGLGLGLSFVKWIVKAHGGSIQVDSQPGHGARFTVSLPIYPTEPTPVARPASTAATLG
jgi:signal transduction histidine kinase